MQRPWCNHYVFIFWFCITQWKKKENEKFMAMRSDEVQHVNKIRNSSVSGKDIIASDPFIRSVHDFIFVVV